MRIRLDILKVKDGYVELRETDNPGKVNEYVKVPTLYCKEGQFLMIDVRYVDNNGQEVQLSEIEEAIKLLDKQVNQTISAMVGEPEK